jgi:hypothetical protein
MSRTLRAELLKLRTTRTSRAFLLAAVCLVAAGVAQQASVAGKGGAPPSSDPGLQAAPLGAGRLAGLAATLTAVLGTAAVLALTGTDPAVTAAGVAAAVAGGTAWAALAALLGFGVGAVARNQPLAGAVLAAYGLALTVGGWVAVRVTEAR